LVAIAPIQPISDDQTPVEGKPADKRYSKLVAPNVSVASIGGILPEDSTQGRSPEARSLPTGFTRDTPFTLSHKVWEPASICHHPLYFQDSMLERHGHERFPHLQPIASGVRFFGTVPIMPYLLTLHPARSNIYNLGHYRTGAAAPCLIERPPYDKHALGVQALTSAGLAVGLAY
jgi:hypothetical protein